MAAKAMTTPIEAETTRIEAALIEKYGERCEDFDPACATCLAWAELQRLTDPHISKPPPQPIRLNWK